MIFTLNTGYNLINSITINTRENREIPIFNRKKTIKTRNFSNKTKEAKRQNYEIFEQLNMNQASRKKQFSPCEELKFYV